MRDALKELGSHINQLGFRAYSVFGHYRDTADGGQVLNDWYEEMPYVGMEDIMGTQFYIRHNGVIRYQEQTNIKRSSFKGPKPFIQTVPLKIVAWSAGGPLFFDPYQLEKQIAALIVGWGGPGSLPAGTVYQYSKPQISELDIFKVFDSEKIKYEGGTHVTGVMIDFELVMLTDCYLSSSDNCSLYLPAPTC